MENFRADNPELVYSAYPGDSFPKQCGLGATGHGAYGTYGKGAFPYPKYQSGCGCNATQAPPEAAIVSSCAPPRDRCGTTEQFAGGANPGCAMPQFWGDKACRLPPTHCGSGLCNGGSMSATGDFEDKQAGFETYDGQIGDYVGAFAGLGADEVPQVGGGCASAMSGCGVNASSGAQHDPGFDGLKCGTPYSAPYAAGPRCGPTETEWSEPSLRIYPVNAPMAPATLNNNNDKVMGMPRFIFNLLVAVAIAMIAYKLLRRK